MLLLRAQARACQMSSCNIASLPHLLRAHVQHLEQLLSQEVGVGHMVQPVVGQATGQQQGRWGRQHRRGRRPGSVGFGRRAGQSPRLASHNTRAGLWSCMHGNWRQRTIGTGPG